MKDFLCVKFLDSNTNDIVSKYWMKGSKKRSWPPEGTEDVQSLVKDQRPTGANWKEYSCEILCEARYKKILANEKNKNILAKFCAKRVRYKKTK